MPLRRREGGAPERLAAGKGEGIPSAAYRTIRTEQPAARTTSRATDPSDG
jgi:hypothetical protein